LFLTFFLIKIEVEKLGVTYGLQDPALDEQQQQEQQIDDSIDSPSETTVSTET
jgi:hypothetical protein